MAESIRILHIGDLHLGVELYGRPDPENGYGTRVGDFLAALDRALEHARESDVVLFPGDVYKNCDPSPTIQREFAARIRRVARAVPVVIIPGNHDLPNAYSRASSVEIFRVLELENVHVIRTPEVVEVATPRGPLLIAALPFTPRSRLLTLDDARGKSVSEILALMRARLIEQIDELAKEAAEMRHKLGEQTPCVLMAHYTIEGAVFGGYGKGALLAPEVELPLASVQNAVFDYIALGHIHKHQTVPANDPSGQPPVVYPGSIERVDFSEEDEDKVAVLAEVTRGNARWTTTPLNPRPFVTITVDADEVEPFDSVKAAIARKKDRLPGAVVRLSYSLPAGLPNIPERELRAALEGVHCVAGIRRETTRLEDRSRNPILNSQLPPLEALDQYIRVQPNLQSQREALLDLARPLIQEAARAAEE